MGEVLAVIGGDLRLINLAKILAKEKNVITFGQELVEGIKYGTDIIKKAENIEDAIKQAKTVIGPIPFSKDGENINAEFSKNIIPIKRLIKSLNGKTLIAGAINKNVYKLAKENNVKIVDLMDNERLTVLNTIATAEGAIEIAIKKTDRVLQGSKTLILGFGRVGKVVARKFASLNSHVTCAARKEEDFAWIETCGYEYININKLGVNLREYDIIINTPPTLILDRQRLQYVKKGCLIIDLASKPGGIDTKAIKELNINFEWALGLPGKVAPITAAKHIKEAVDDILNTEDN